MGRRSPRTPIPVRSERWRAVRDGSGRWKVVNARGEEPLRSADPFEQMTAAHLAAAAPALRDCLTELLNRFAAIESPYSRDDQRIRIAWGEIVLSRPTGYDIRRAIDAGSQLELDLTGEEVA